MDGSPSPYATAKDLARDIERFLSGEPIEARPVSVFTRAARFVRRRTTLVLLFVAAAAIAGLLWKQYQRMQAEALADEAARKIEEFDRLIYLPPRNLADHHGLLREALRLGDDYQRARALARLGREDEAEQAITKAIRQRPDGLHYLERARIRLQRITRTLASAPQLALMQYSVGSHNPTTAIRRQIQSAGISEDLAEAGLRELLARCSPFEQAELHKVLAWNRYLRILAKLPAADP